jgi:hypothetical protein
MFEGLIQLSKNQSTFLFGTRGNLYILDGILIYPRAIGIKKYLFNLDPAAEE